MGVCERRDVIKRKRLSQGASNTCWLSICFSKILSFMENRLVLLRISFMWENIIDVILLCLWHYQKFHRAAMDISYHTGNFWIHFLILVLLKTSSYSDTAENEFTSDRFWWYNIIWKWAISRKFMGHFHNIFHFMSNTDDINGRKKIYQYRNKKIIRMNKGSKFLCSKDTFVIHSLLLWITD